MELPCCVLVYWNAPIPTGASSSAVNSSGCSKCGTIMKSGTLSCCARGGAWFQKCGDAGDTNFDHTWVEGIQACKGFASSFPVKPPAPAMLHHERAIAQTLNFTLKRHSTQQQQTNTYLADSLFDADITNCRGCIEIPKIVVYISIVFIGLHLQL